MKTIWEILKGIVEAIAAVFGVVVWAAQKVYSAGYHLMYGEAPPSEVARREEGEKARQVAEQEQRAKKVKELSMSLVSVCEAVAIGQKPCNVPKALARAAEGMTPSDANWILAAKATEIDRWLSGASIEGLTLMASGARNYPKGSLKAVKEARMKQVLSSRADEAIPSLRWVTEPTPRSAGPRLS